MNIDIKDMKLKHWAILAAVLLVLVGIFVAYSVFVPKLQEVETLEKNLQAARAEENSLRATEIQARPTDVDKLTVASKLPVTHDQSRFLKMLHENEQEANVVIKTFEFSEEDVTVKKDSAKQEATAAKEAKAAGEQSEIPLAAGMQKYNGKMTIEGDYQQIRTFIEKFSGQQRLITFNTWNFKAEDVVRQITRYRMEAKQQNGGKATSGRVYDAQGVNTDGTGTSEDDQQQDEATPAEEIADDLRQDNMLSDRTLLYTEQEFNRVMETIRAALPDPPKQREIDIANLQIQQAFNRYMGGLLGRKEAESVFDQTTAYRFLPSANTNIKSVLGLKSAPEQQLNASPGSLITNLPFEYVPVIDSKRSSLLSPLLTLTIEFSIYAAPGAADILPASTPIETYTSEQRSNPVEPW